MYFNLCTWNLDHIINFGSTAAMCYCYINISSSAKWLVSMLPMLSKGLGIRYKSTSPSPLPVPVSVPILVTLLFDCVAYPYQWIQVKSISLFKRFLFTACNGQNTVVRISVSIKRSSQCYSYFLAFSAFLQRGPLWDLQILGYVTQSRTYAVIPNIT